MKKHPKEIESLNQAPWSVDLDDVSVEALERRFELAVATTQLDLCEPICSPICSFCNPVAA